MVRLNCALCGRPVLSPAVLIGQMPVGPKCARRAGLLELAKRRVGQLSLPRLQRRAPLPSAQNLDLFEERGAT